MSVTFAWPARATEQAAWAWPSCVRGVPALWVSASTSICCESGSRYRVGSFAFDWRVGTVAFCGFYSRRGVRLVNMMGLVLSTSWCKLHVDFADCMRVGISMADEHVGTVACEYV
jgi:hypothetical protein